MNTTDTGWEKDFDRMYVQSARDGILPFDAIKNFVINLLEVERTKARTEGQLNAGYDAAKLAEKMRDDLRSALRQQREELAEKVSLAKAQCGCEEHERYWNGALNAVLSLLSPNTNNNKHEN